MNKKTWTPNESDVIETRDVFRIDQVVDSVNLYWYAGKNKAQSINILIHILKDMLKKEKENES